MEGDIAACHLLLTTSLAATQSLMLLNTSAISFLHSQGIDPSGCHRLLHLFKSIGLENCTQDVFSSDRDPSLRAEFSDVQARALLGILETAGLKRWDGWDMEKVRELERNVFAELETGEVYMRYDLHIVVG